MSKEYDLDLSALASLTKGMSEDLFKLANMDAKKISSKRYYVVDCKKEKESVESSARKAYFESIVKSSSRSEQLIKYAFDTRKIDQQLQKNPRRNCQNWHRSEQFITEDVQIKLDKFAKLYSVLEDIKSTYEREPEYHDSYVRELHGHVKRALKVNEKDADIFEPQLNYVEQLVNARYLLSLDDIILKDAKAIKKALLDKDEALLKRGAYLYRTAEPELQKSSAGNQGFIVDGKSTTQDNIINAIFGNNDLRRNGEKKVTRTITITVTDQAEE